MKNRISYGVLLILAVISLSNTLLAQKLEYNARCQKAYQYFISFRMSEGRAELAKEITENKTNVLPYILINYDEFLTLCFNENPSQYKLKKELQKTRLNVLEKSNHQSPYYLFLKGLLYFQWSMIQAKHKDYLNAALDFRHAHLLFKENQEKFPAFTQNNIFLGMQEAFISTIPKGYKWVASLLGLNGNLTKGMSMMNSYIASGQPAFREEAMIYYIYLKNYLENDPKGAFDLFTTYQLDTKNNLLFAFVAANLALNNKNASEAEDALLNRNTGANYEDFPMLQYELADAKLKKLDFTAIGYFEKYIASYKGYFYIKDAYYQLALAYYLQGNRDKANLCLQKVISQGYAETDADKQALKQAKRNYFPNKELLKARLLNDGGYNKEALKILETLSPKVLSSECERLEYNYRFARVYDDLQNDDKAILFYQVTLRDGESSTEYFAARSALQLAFLYEKRKQKELAIQYYNKVLNMEDHDYKNSLDQRAKSGLNRIKKN